MSQQMVLIVGEERTRLRRVARALVEYSLESTLRTCLETSRKDLRSDKYSALLIHESAANGQLRKFCSAVRADDPGLVIVAWMTEIKGMLEQRLFDHGIDDVVTNASTAKVISKRIVDKLETRCVTRGPDSNLRVGRAVVDMANLEIWNRGKIVSISKGLTQFLQYFIKNRGRTIPRAEVYEVLWADSVVDPEGKNVDVQVSKLRQLIEPDPKHPTLIRTVRGIGYMLCLPGRRGNK